MFFWLLPCSPSLIWRERPCSVHPCANITTYISTQNMNCIDAPCLHFIWSYVMPKTKQQAISKPTFQSDSLDHQNRTCERSSQRTISDSRRKSLNKTLEEVKHRKELYKRYKTTEMTDMYFLEFRAPKTTVWNTPKKVNWKRLWLSHWAVLAGRTDDFSCQALIIS